MLRGGKLLHVAIVLVLLAGGLAVVGMLRRSYVAETGMSTLEHQISKRLGADVTIDRVRGGILKGLALEGATVRAKGGTLLRIPRLVLGYRVTDLLRGPRVIDELRLVEPHLLIGEGESGGERRGTRFPSLPLGVKRLVVEKGSIERGSVSVRNLSLFGTVEAAGGVTVLRIDSLRGDLLLPPDRSVPFRVQGNARFGPAEACSLAISGEAAGSRFEHAGAFQLGAELHGEGEIRLMPLDLDEILQIATGREEAKGSEIEARIRFAGVPDSLAIAFEASGTVREFPFEGLRARGFFARRALALDTLAFEAAGAAFRGDGSLDLTGGRSSRLALSFEHLDPGRYAAALAERPADLNGSLTWEGTGGELRDLAGRIGLRLGSSEIAGVAIREANLTGAAVPGGIAVDTSFVRTAGAELRFSGFVGYEGSLRGSVRGTIPSLAEFRELARLDSLSGSATVSATVEGSPRDMRATGSLVVERGAAGPIGFERLLIDGSVERGPVATSGSMRARLANGEVEGHSFDSLAADLRLDRGVVRIGRLHASRGDLDVRGSGRASREGGLLQLVLDGLTVLDGDTTLTETGRVVVRQEHGGVTLEPVEFPFGGGSVRAEASRGESGELRAELRIVGADLRRLAGLLSVPPPLLASVDVDASYAATGERRAGAVFFVSRPPATPEFPFRRVEGSGHLDGAAITIDSLVIQAMEEGARLRAAGTLERAGAGETAVSARLRADDMPVREFRFLNSHLNEVEGDLNGDMVLEGSLENPRIRASLALSGAVFRGYPLGTLHADSVSIGGDSLGFALRFDSDRGEENRIGGSLPVRISLRPQTFSWLQDGPLRVDFRVPHGDLRSLALLAGRGDEAIGAFRWNAALRGTPAKPDLNGTFEIEDALIFPAGVSFFFDRADARLLLDEDYITIVAFEARTGNRGRVNAWGRVDLVSLLPAGYDIHFHAQDYDISLAEGVEATFDGDLTLRADSTVLRRTVPHVAGRVDVRGALVGLEFGEEEGAAPNILDPSDAPEWTCDVFVRAPRNLWVRNSLVDLELSGEAQVRRSDQGLGALGSFEVLRGSYYIYPNEFRIRSGEVQFTNADDLREAKIDVLAETRVMGEKIEVHAYGGAEDIRVEPTSESGYSESEILGMLALRTRPEDNVRSGEVLSSWAQTLASRLSREVSKGLGDIGTIEIGTSEDLPELRYGNYVSSDLYLGFSQKIDAGLNRPEQERSPTQEYLAIPDRQLRVEYRLRRSLLVEGEVGTLRSGDRFLNLDLKVRVSY